MMDRPLPWFALTSKPRHEKVVEHILRNKGLEPFLPLYRARHRWSDRLKSVDLPLFPGYVFCRLDYERRMAVLTVPGVTSIVGFDRAPAPIPDEEIDRIHAILASGLPAQPWPFIRVGQLVRVERGSLAGLEGILLREKDSLRVVVSIEMLRRSVALEIDRDMICAVQSAVYSPVARLYLSC